jgi:hypothetical protein
MTPEERILFFRKDYPERDWPFIEPDGNLDLMAKGLAKKAKCTEERRIAEGMPPTEGEMGLW